MAGQMFCSEPSVGTAALAAWNHPGVGLVCSLSVGEERLVGEETGPVAYPSRASVFYS